MSDAPLPVEVVSPVPIPVEVVAVRPPGGLGGSSPLPANTTAQQDLVTAGQRHINVMWERTQQVIAVAVSAFTLSACLYLVIYGDPSMAVPAFLLLSNVFFLVVGTYFQRTNHTKTGGVGFGESGR